MIRVLFSKIYDSSTMVRWYSSKCAVQCIVFQHMIVVLRGVVLISDRLSLQSIQNKYCCLLSLNESSYDTFFGQRFKKRLRCSKLEICTTQLLAIYSFFRKCPQCLHFGGKIHEEFFQLVANCTCHDWQHVPLQFHLGELSEEIWFANGPALDSASLLFVPFTLNGHDG